MKLKQQKCIIETLEQSMISKWKKKMRALFLWPYWPRKHENTTVYVIFRLSPWPWKWIKVLKTGMNRYSIPSCKVWRISLKQCPRKGQHYAQIISPEMIPLPPLITWRSLKVSCDFVYMCSNYTKFDVHWTILRNSTFGFISQTPPWPWN